MRKVFVPVDSKQMCISLITHRVFFVSTIGDEYELFVIIDKKLKFLRIEIRFFKLCFQHLFCASVSCHTRIMNSAKGKLNLFL